MFGIGQCVYAIYVCVHDMKVVCCEGVSGLAQLRVEQRRAYPFIVYSTEFLLFSSASARCVMSA